jgi:UDP-glucose:(glucosyl)LPS alpha-1,2-glucosyltransferase
MIEYSNSSICGTEIISKKVSSIIPKKLLNKFQIISQGANIEYLDGKKIRLMWFHNTTEQSHNKFLERDGWKKFHKIIFISHHQMEEYVKEYQIPYSHCVVMKYALEPIKSQPKPTNKISLIYTSMPYRGLDILVNVFEKLCEEYDNLELKVHSSYTIFGSEEKQKIYEKTPLYQKLEAHPKIKNIGYVSNEELKKSLASSHIFAYPSIWKETFCLALLEAMSAGLLCVHPNYACLPETASNWTIMYSFDENIKTHEESFYKKLKNAIEIVNQKETQEHLKKQKEYVDYFFNWNRRTQEWIDLLKSLEHLNPKIKQKSILIYT